MPLTCALMGKASVVVHSARVCQQNGIVPSVKSEILPDRDLDLENWQYVTLKKCWLLSKGLQVTTTSTLKDLAEAQHGHPCYACTQKFSKEELTIATVKDLIAHYPFLFLGARTCLEGRVRKGCPSTSILSANSPSDKMGLDLFLWLSPSGLFTKDQKQEGDPGNYAKGVHEGSLVNCPSYQQMSTQVVSLRHR